MWLAYIFGTCFAKRVYLGKNRCPEDYEEFTDEEKQMREQALFEQENDEN